MSQVHNVTHVPVHSPKGSFYNFFPSKEAFAAEVIDAYSHRGQERLRRYLLNQNVTR